MKTENKLIQIQLFDRKIILDLKADLKKWKARKRNRTLAAAA
ncbi:hypothetical protein [Mucilaginibacter corticis]|nr:hypothetical protein [Mucilaginibacter corticis]